CRPPRSHFPPPRPAPLSRCRRRARPPSRAPRDGFALRSGCCGPWGHSSIPRGLEDLQPLVQLRLRHARTPARSCRTCHPRLQRLLLHFLLRAQPGGNLLLGFLFRDAVGFLDLADELVALAGSRFQLTIAQLAPLLPGAALELLPVAFNAIPVHLIPFGYLAAGRLPRSFEVLHCNRVWAHEPARSVRGAA